MEQKPHFRYYYGNEAEQFSFFKIPKLLITHEFFHELSNDAKILYGLLLDRMSLSVKNKWFDEEKRAYIIFGIEEIAEILHCSRGKAIKTLQELDSEKGIGLIEKRRLGQGNNTVMYVKNFMIQQQLISRQSDAANTFSEVQNLNFQKSKKRTSRSTKFELLEIQNMDPNKNYINKTDINNTDSNRIASIEASPRYDHGSDAETHLTYQKLISQNIDYPALLETHPTERDIIHGIYQLIVETIMASADKILISSNWYPASLVRSKFLKLNYSHIEYVMDMLRSNTTRVRNIKKYILAALFNAPNTIDSYYRAAVNHDMPELAKVK